MAKQEMDYRKPISWNLDTSAKLSTMSGYVLKAAKRVFGNSDFKYYAMNDRLSSMFTRSLGKLATSPFAEKEPMQ